MRQRHALLFIICTFGMFFTSFASTNECRLPVLIRDARTQLPIVGARTCIGTDSLCKRSDSAGSITFTELPPGQYEVTVSDSGYEPAVEHNIVIHRGLNYQLVVELSRETAAFLDKLTITARRPIQKKPSQSTSNTRVTTFELSNTPGTANDINRVLASYPGVVSASGADFDNNLYVRGGGSNENVYVIDGIELDNANHFSQVDQSGGAMSFLSGTLVQDLDFYTGGFPASLPPRLSSVIDMRLRTGSFTSYKREIDVNMAGLGLTFEGPISRKLSFLTGFRMVDIRLLSDFIDVGIGIPRFGDGMLKLVYVPNEHNTISATGLGAIDNYNEAYDQNDFRFPTTYDEWTYQGGGSVDWTWSTSQMKNCLSFSGSARRNSAYDLAITTSQAMAVDTFTENISEWNRSETHADSLILPTDTLFVQQSRYTNGRLWERGDTRWNIAGNDQFTLFLRDNDQLSIGGTMSTKWYHLKDINAYEGSSSLLYLQDGNRVLTSLYSSHPSHSDSTIDVRHVGGYVEYVFNQDWLKIIAGLRGDYYTVITDYGISPRLGIRCDLGHFGVVSTSGGLYYQFPADFNGLIYDILSLASNPDYSSATPLDEARLQRNWQGVVRYERTIGNNHLLTLESYYKYYDREYPLKSPDNRRYFDYNNYTINWLLDNPNGEKKAYGFEAFFQKSKHDIFYYALSYSLFAVKNRYVNNQWYNDENNVKTTIGLTLGSNFTKNQGLSFRMAAMGGRPYSPIKRATMGNSFTYDTTAGYYSKQLDPVISASLRYSFTCNFSWGDVTGYIEIWNLFNNQPVVQRFFDERIGYNDLKPAGILPIGGVKVDF